MRQFLTLCTVLLMSAASAQLAFTNASVILPHAGHAGACVGVCDMDGDGLDDIIQLDMSKHVYILYQNTDHTFVSYDYGQVDGSSQWGWAIADLDNDGHKDICSGVSTTRFLHITARGVYTLSNLNGPTLFTQCMTMADWNNDGRVDVFACNDVGPSNIWITNPSGTPIYDANYMPWATSCTTSPSNDMSGNYGSTASDFDNDGDIDLHISHCRQGVNDPNDCRRWDRLFVNDGNGNYSDEADVYGMENHEQVWTTDFGDYDNDGDLDAFSTTHSSTLMLFENDGTGHFTNVTAGSGLEISGFFLQAKMEDMDNDGFLDILTGSAEHFFKGHGNGTFTEISNLFPSSKNILSFAFGDMNGDGFQDVYAGYGDGYVDGDAAFPDRLWLNTPNGNHWLNVDLTGVVSNKDAVGARVTINGPWGTMIREVHAGESYGIVNSFILHFGLGDYTTIPTLTITWPSGQVDTYNDVAVDQVIGAIEGTCLSPSASITTPTAPIVCGNGDMLTLSANPGFNYVWSTGATTQSIDVSTPGNYVVTIDDGSGCEAVTSITVTQSPDETPTLILAGEEMFCEGGQVVITSSAAASYDWSNGGTDQSITVTTSGTYHVTIQGVCGDATSADVVVTVLDAPDAPAADDVNIPSPGTADLIATGANIQWYDVATGGTPIGTGNGFTTPFLGANTTYYVSAGNVYGGGDWYGGPQDRLNTTTPGQYHTNADNYLFFEGYEAFNVVSVKVYANGAGDRTIALTDRSNGATLATGVYNIPDGESRVTLNYAVPGAGSFGLRVVGGNPQLWRDGNGSNPAFPYALGTVGAITSSSVAGANALAFYYFFYDWEVEANGNICESTRTPVEVTVGAVGVGDLAANNTIGVFPNPASDQLTVSLGGVQNATVDMLDITGRVAKTVTAAQQGATITFGVNDLSAGEYVVRVRHANGTSMHRVVIK
ncbi:MAG: VCBS repeat-containing protein [Flavobacteriales bacterium]|nr:VCBS repeat-containing protein [Flavobacteriales bacterium]